MVLMVRGRPVTPGRITQWILLAALGLFVVYLRIAWSAGRSELREMCERDFRPKVYRQVSAAGYYEHKLSCIEDGCWDVLISKPFRFIEFENDRILHNEPLKEKGFYRATKVRIDSGECDERVSQQLQSWAVLKPYYAAGNCIRIDKLEHPTARYGLYVERLPQVKLDNWYGSVIKRLHAYIKDMETGEIIAEQSSPMLFQRSMPSFSSFENMIHCRTRGIMDTTDIKQIVTVEDFINPE